MADDKKDDPPIQEAEVVNSTKPKEKPTVVDPN